MHKEIAVDSVYSRGRNESTVNLIMEITLEEKADKFLLILDI